MKIYLLLIIYTVRLNCSQHFRICDKKYHVEKCIRNSNLFEIFARIFFADLQNDDLVFGVGIAGLVVLIASAVIIAVW